MNQPYACYSMPDSPIQSGPDTDWTNQPFSPFKVDYSFQGSLQPAYPHKQNCESML